MNLEQLGASWRSDLSIWQVFVFAIQDFSSFLDTSF